MKNYFADLSHKLNQTLQKDEFLTCALSSEETDFVRFNKARIRQPGHVSQHVFTLTLIRGQRQTSSTMNLAGNFEQDFSTLQNRLAKMRVQLDYIPNDPYLIYSTTVHSTEHIKPSRLQSSNEIVSTVLHAVQDLDFVGILAVGRLYRGFSNSLGQINWFENSSFNIDYCLYAHADKAVKSNYAGFEFDASAFAAQIERNKHELSIVSKSPKEISKGHYRAYLSPSAMHEILSLLSWGGFSHKCHQTKYSPLLRMSEEKTELSAMFSLTENTEGGIGPAFDLSGFIKPDRVSLIHEGKLQSLLTSPRTAKEYGIATNGANQSEVPESMDVAAGHLSKHNILTELGTGIYINNLWYLNFSDRTQGRFTGMTRFATYWVENGQITAPLNVMRFDDCIFDILNHNLVGLTKERDFVIDSGTYEERSTYSAHLPGALLSSFALTL